MQRICLATWSLMIALLCTLAVVAQQAEVAPPPATVTGSGTADYVPLWTGTTTLGKSTMFQTNGWIGVGLTAPTVRLDVDGRVNVTKSYRIGGVDVLATPGGVAGNNVALGNQASLHTSTGTGNTAVGSDSLTFNTTGRSNTASGLSALGLNVGGNYNTAAGAFSLGQNNSGTENAAFGFDSLNSNTTGAFNTALGGEALYFNSTGNRNVAIGFQAAKSVSPGNSENIHIGSLGVSTDNGVIRIGTSGDQTSLFVAGISGVTTGLNDAVPVVIDSNGQLGTISSSRRFKEDIQDMGEASSGLMRLRPVTFRYQKTFTDGSKPVQYGLIAEEVAEVYPDLVVHSPDGQVETVKYQVLDSMLLNEVQRQQAEIQSLQERLAKMEAALTAVSRASESH